MKIKRFNGPDMRHTLRLVSEELGPDAVILSNQKVNGGIEIVAAIDYDESLLDDKKSSKNISHEEKQALNEKRQEALDDIRYARNLPESQAKVSIPEPKSPAFDEMQSELKSLKSMLLNQISGMAWEHESRLHPIKTRLMQRLMGFGLSPKLAKKVASTAREDVDMEQNWRMALANIAHQLTVTDDDILTRGGVIALVGATGVGKTTTVAKLAARYILRHGQDSVALITTDNYRVAAHEQLRSYARIMGIPMRIAADENALRDALISFRNKGLVLIDTAGMSQRDVEISKQLSLIK